MLCREEQDWHRGGVAHFCKVGEWERGNYHRSGRTVGRRFLETAGRGGGLRPRTRMLCLSSRQREGLSLSPKENKTGREGLTARSKESKVY